MIPSVAIRVLCLIFFRGWKPACGGFVLPPGVAKVTPRRCEACPVVIGRRFGLRPLQFTVVIVTMPRLTSR